MLELQNISVQFGGIKALNNVSFKIEKQSLFSIIGPNGAGKTSLLNVISGRYKANNGKLFYKNSDITNLHPNKRPELGIGRTFQNLALFDHMTVLDNIFIGRHHLLKSNFLKGCIYWLFGGQKEEIENRIEAEKHGLPKPTSWAELTNPIYKGHISMPNPASSGTGFLDASSWIQIWGEDKAWEYMDALHENIGVYTHSGSKPCKQAGSGEFAIGISWPGRAIKVIKAGAPIDMIIPDEGIGWEMQVVAIMEGTDNLEDAKTLMDWTLGDGMKLFGERQSIIADSSKVTKDPELPDFYDEVQAKLINNDFVWAAANKDRIVAEWKKR